MTARKCKVCGLVRHDVGGGWCMKCWRAYDRKPWQISDGIAAGIEWGAKRRAAASKASPVITLVRLNDDWSGIYVDGKLVNEDHSLSDIDVLRALGLPFQTVPVQLDDESLPENLPAEWARKADKFR